MSSTPLLKKPTISVDKVKMITRLVALLLVSGSELSANSQEFTMPTAKPGKVVWLVLNEGQAEGLLKKKNYSAPSSKGGVCYGIDRLNYTFLSYLNFQEGVEMSPSEIKAAILKAHDLGVPVSIRGFKDLPTFVRAMESRWEDAHNPVKAAIEELQQRQAPFGVLKGTARKARAVHAMGEGALLEEMEAIKNSLLQGVTVPAFIKDAGGAHALTFVGFEGSLGKGDADSSSTSDGPRFFVLDSNLPNQMSEIRIRTRTTRFTGPYGTEKTEKRGWYYAPWDNSVTGKTTGTADGIVVLGLTPEIQSPPAGTEKRLGVYFLTDGMKQTEDLWALTDKLISKSNCSEKKIDLKGLWKGVVDKNSSIINKPGLSPEQLKNVSDDLPIKNGDDQGLKPRHADPLKD